MRFRGAVFVLTLATLGLIVACSDGQQNICMCPAGNGQATVRAECATIVSYAEVSDDDCGIGQPDPETLYVSSDSPGSCRIEVTLAGGTTLTTDIAFTPYWMPCGSDPHGCGQGVMAAPGEITLATCGDASAGSGG